ncbi:MAG: ATP12 family protein [Rhodospirillales bacterium]
MADDKTAGLRRRFYTRVGIRAEQGGYAVLLDDRPFRTPGRVILLTSTEALGEAIAAEWEAQGEKINPHSMPLTQIACTVTDHIVPGRSDIEEQLARFAEADLLCYRAENPKDLALRQQQMWQPVLDWLSGQHGIDFAVTTAVIAEPQPEQALAKIRAVIAACDDHELAALSVLTQAMGSLSLGLAVMQDYLDWESAAKAAQLDETFQSELWGSDREAELRLKALRDDMEAAGRYLRLHRS